jgi:hypothetical protein
MDDGISSSSGTDRPEIFWGEIAPCEHLVQFYANDEAFFEVLEGFVLAGIRAGEAIVLIATPEHLAALEQRLCAHEGIDLDALRASDAYIALDAKGTLAQFMFDGWPDDEAFRRVVAELLARATRGGRRVRAFGEMVAILWEQGYCGATVRLEYLWQNLCRAEAFSLLCAYPKSGFTGDPTASLQNICAAHSRVL